MKFNVSALCLAISTHLCAFEDFPDEFADFFQEREAMVKLFVAGESRSENVRALVTHDSFKLINTPDNLKKLQAYLQTNNLTASAIENIQTHLLAGVNNLISCEGEISLCLPEDKPNQAEYTFDFDSKQLKTYVSSDLLKGKSSIAEYHSAIREQSALINNTNLYAYYNNDSDAQFTWNNEAVLGLPLGHFLLDTQYSSNENEFDLYQAVYNLEVKNVRAVLGYQDFNRINLNSTDFLSYGTDFSGTALTIGSSQNLLKGGIEAQQRIYFYAPEAGQLEIYQGERLLLTRSITSGQQFISYDELPKGIYNISIVLRRGENELLREQRQVVNNSQFSLPVGSWDYRYQTGFFDNDNALVENSQRYYWHGAISYRVAESVLLGSGFTANKDNIALQLGGFWSPLSKVNLQYSTNIFNSGANYHSAQLSYHLFSASVRKINVEGFDDSLSKQLYAENDYLEWSFGVSGNLLGGNSYLSYNDYKYNGSNNSIPNSQSLSASWSRELFGGNFSLGVFQTRYDNADDEWSANLSWSRKFNDNFSMRFSGYTDNDNDHSLQTSATYMTKGENWQASTTAGIRASDETIADLSANLSGNNDYLKYSLYGYVNNENEQSISGSLSSTQIIAKTGVEATYQSGKSFVSIEPTLTDETDRDIQINYQFIRNSNAWQKGAVSAKGTQTLAVTPYHEVGVYLDADISNAEVQYDGSQKFIMPGMHYQVATAVTPLETQLVVLSDANGRNVDFVQCANNACKSVEQVSEDGVYRVKYSKDENFSLTASNMTCLYDQNQLGQDYITSSCLTDVQIAQQNSETLNNFTTAITPSDEKLISNEQLVKMMARIKEIQDSIRQANANIK